MPATTFASRPVGCLASDVGPARRRCCYLTYTRLERVLVSALTLKKRFRYEERPEALVFTVHVNWIPFRRRYALLSGRALRVGPLGPFNGVEISQQSQTSESIIAGGWSS